MAKKSVAKPNVVSAKVVRKYHNFDDALHDVYLADKKTYKPIKPIRLSESAMPKDLKEGCSLTIWVSVDSEYKHIAFGDRIIEHNDRLVLDDATQKHFDDYQQKLKMRLALKNNLAEIERKIAVIKLINTELDADAEKAKETLIGFLNNTAEKLRTDSGKKR